MKKGLLLLPLVGGMMLSGCDLSNLQLTDLIDPLHIIWKKDKEEDQGGNQNQGNNNQGNTTGGNTTGGNTTGGNTTGGNTTGGDDSGTGGGNTTGGGTEVSGDPVNVNGLNLDFATNFATYKQAFPFVDANTGTYQVTLDGVTFEGLQCFVGSYSGAGYLMMKNKDMGGQCAYLTQATPFQKSITKVEIVTGSSASGKSEYAVVLDNKPITSASGAVTQNGVGAGKTITATADASAGYKYFAVYSTNVEVNSQLASIVVTVA